MNFLLDPSVYYLSEEEWNDEEKKDEFLDNFQKYLKLLDLIEQSILLWTDELEALLWESPHHPPWRGNQDFMNQQISFLIKKFNLKCEIINLNHSYSSCVINPILNYDNKYDQGFKNLCSQIVEEERKSNLLIAPRQIDREVTELKCQTPMKVFKIESFKDIKKLLIKNSIIEYFWPKTIDDLDIFKNYINLLLSYENKINKFNLDESFIKDLINKVTDIRFKNKIITTIVKRLCLNSHEASIDFSLHEETIKTEKRIRVTQKPTSTRIHFKFNDETIIFKNFYAEGEHDDPL